MQSRIARLNWEFNHDISTNKTTLKDRFKNLAASLGLEIGYKKQDSALDIDNYL